MMKRTDATGDMVPFTVTEDHIALMKDLSFGLWASLECGLDLMPEIDPKRPFGNSGSIHSIGECLGLLDSSGELSRLARSKCFRLAAELPCALSAVLAAGSVAPGTYQVPRYSNAACQHAEYMLVWFWLDAFDSLWDRGHDIRVWVDMVRSCHIKDGNPYRVLGELQSWFGDSGNAANRNCLRTFLDIAKARHARVHGCAPGVPDGQFLAGLLEMPDLSDPDLAPEVWPFIPDSIREEYKRREMMGNG